LPAIVEWRQSIKLTDKTDMQYFPLFLLLLFGLVLLSRPLTVLFHELGHAISIVLLTKQKVTIYIGSYGDPKRSVKINLGMLAIFFRYNPFAWRLGLCVPSATSVSINRQIVYTVAGPVASLIIAAVAVYFTFTYDLHGFLKLFLLVFLGSAFVDLLVNLIPDKTPLELYDGTIAYNDGYSLKQLIYYKQLPKGYSEAVELYNERKFADAAVLLAKFLSKTKDENIYRLAISSYLQYKNYEKAKELSAAFALTGKMNSDDFSNSALSCSQLGFHDEALKLYDTSLQLNPHNKYSLNNKGYTLNLIDNFAEAIHLFDRAIEIDKDFAYSYNNRGLAKIKLGQTEEGLKDIDRSFELDPDNSYGYRNLGVYYFDKGEFKEALRLFTRAKELDNTTYMIDELIQNATNKLAEG
jgi:tetratricopeptide (TPR) repeat protein